MTALTVVAKLKAKSGCEEKLAALLQGLVAPTRAEAGCLAYDLHRSHDDPGTFLFTESWASRALWDAHMASPHLAAFGEQQGAVTESWDLFTGEKV
jgi:quinol monooxygenase YgiN